MKAKIGEIAARDEEIAAAITRDQANYRRILFVAIPNEHVLNDRDPLVAGVKNGLIQYLRDIEHR